LCDYNEGRGVDEMEGWRKSKRQKGLRKGVEGWGYMKTEGENERVEEEEEEE